MALADSKTLKAMVEFREGKMFGFILIMILDGSWRYEQIIEFLKKYKYDAEHISTSKFQLALHFDAGLFFY